MRRQSVPVIREARRDDIPALAHLHVATFKETHERLGAERLLSADDEFHGGYGWRDLHGLTIPSGSAPPRA